MSKQSKAQTNVRPAVSIPGTKDPILSTGPPKDAEDWKVKNARAKELIMSTLVPGSEPWKIAEPLELASDIWKALEARYAPVDGQTIVDAMKAEDNITEENDSEIHRRKEAQARATKEFYESMPSRDQRFLWALLHGGKEETNAWFYGTDAET